LNEAGLLPGWLQELDKVASELTKFRSTVLIVDDGSTDATSEVLHSLKNEFKHIEIQALTLSRNFGHQGALLAGLLSVPDTADVVVTMDSDGEHPATLIPALLDYWNEGHQIVHTVRLESEELPLIKRVLSKSFYRIISRITGVKIRAGMSDFKLWDVKLIRELDAYFPHCGSLRLFASYIAPQGPVVEFKQVVIPGRKSRFTFRKMLSLAMQSVVFYSSFPMRIIGLLGIASMLAGVALIIHVLIAYATGKPVQGWASTMIVLVFFCGLNTLSVYVLSEYLLRISFRSRLPQYVISRRL
jgi:dolichol-phosphate mannosyltransferase